MADQSFKLAVGTGSAGFGDRAPTTIGDVRYPFSGNVTQTINPWTWFLRLSGIDIENLTINLGRSTNPELEQQILQRVGTYGRQLGVIGDALGVLMDHMQGKEHLTDRERRALDRLRSQLDEIDKLKPDADEDGRRRSRASSPSGGVPPSGGGGEPADT